MNKDLQMSKLVSIDSHYRRSVKLDVDFGNASALGAYICNRSARVVVDALAKHISDGNQYAFTITGPYGGGKSSLALVLASSIQSNEELRTKALQRLDLDTKSRLKVAFPFEMGRLVIPVSGSKSNPVKLIGARLNEACGKKIFDPALDDGRSLIDIILKQAKSKKHDGIVLIIDELGKLLESCAQGDGDINFFQDLAEASARSLGRLVVIGVLHQAFQQYVARIGGGFRTEWAKVQGRFIDIPLVAGADEVVNLIGKAIASKINHPWSEPHSKVVADSLKKNRAALADDILASLDDCWPMHPVMAVLLGPFSRRQFGQNERSVFGFLSTAEPNGFKHYLENVNEPNAAFYRPCNFWDYLKSNLEPAILTSTDAHRWAQASEAVAKVESKGDLELIALIKNIAVIDLFKAGSGLEATQEILESLWSSTSKSGLPDALCKLAEMRVAIFRKHKSAWAIFEGSDFDVDEEIEKVLLADERSPVELVKEYVQLHPVVAKRHYYEKGALRWMDIEICDEKTIRDISEDDGSLGKFVVCLFGDGLSATEAKKIASAISSVSIIPGVSKESSQILESAKELSALISISQKNHKLVGDSVARKEVYSRIASIKAGLELHIRAVIQNSEWLVGGKWSSESSLSILASKVADNKFSETPRLKNELLNRVDISTNAVKARRELLYRMLRNEGEANLGLSGWPAERGLYESVLAESTIHRQNEEGDWGFLEPTDDDPLNCLPVWNCFKHAISEDQLINLKSLYAASELAPYGVKPGLLPVLFFAYFLANKNSVAVYKDGMFVPQLTEADIDEFLKEPSRFELRSVIINESKIAQLKGYVGVLKDLGRPLLEITPLAIARGLVSVAFQLPEWTRRTRKLSDEAIKLRDLLLRASDPHKLLFIDIPEHFSASGSPKESSKIAGLALAELDRAYPAMLTSIEQKMLEYMEALPLDFSSLHLRANAVEGVSGDFRLNAFSSRIKDYDGSVERLEGILSLAANKPPKTWADSDIDNALLELTGWATRFRQVEALANVQGREPTREAFAVVIGSGGSTKSLMRNFDISKNDREKASKIANQILDLCNREGVKEPIALAAFALAGIQISENVHG